MNALEQKSCWSPPPVRPPMRVAPVGDVGNPQFAQALATLEHQAQVSYRSIVDRPPPSWDLLVVCQERPGSLAARSLAHWVSAHPLAGRIVLLGSWCEGETRTGRPLESLRRLFWYEFPAWWAETCDAWSRGTPTEWHWPGEPPPMLETAAAAHQLIAIASPDYDSASALFDMCRATSRLACWCREGSPWPVVSAPAAGIWVGAMFDEAERASLRRFRQWLPAEAPLVALLDFPRLERATAVQAAGATAVLGKPFRVDHLLAALDAPRTEATVVADGSR